MARQRVHNRRAGGRGSAGGGASWISYSDMMASLLLVFVLILCVALYQYFTMLDAKTNELDAQRVLLVQQQATLDDQSAQLTAQQQTLDIQSATLLAQQATLDDQSAQLAAQQVTLNAQTITLNQQAATLAQQQAALEESNAALASKEVELYNLATQLTTQQTALDAATALLKSQQAALDAQANKIDDLVGVRTQIITDLSTALSRANLRAMVDPNDGAIVLDSAVFFESGSNTIKAEGRMLLDQFVPVYLSVLLQPQYADYLGEIIIEGHTDTVGDYFMNLKLSQNRALAVVEYCLQMPALTETQRTMLRSILTATGRSYSDPVYYSNGSVNLDASRRVEFKFSLRDAEMIDEMNRLLQSH